LGNQFFKKNSSYTTEIELLVVLVSDDWILFVIHIKETGGNPVSSLNHLLHSVHKYFT